MFRRLGTSCSGCVSRRIERRVWIPTRHGTGQQILFDPGAECLLTARGSQSALEANLERLLEKKSLSPSPHAQQPGDSNGSTPATTRGINFWTA